MPDKIALNTPQYKGEFDFDIVGQPLTGIEWRWVKKISGYLPLTIDEGWRGGDPDLFIAFAVIALYRAGRVREEDALMTAELLAMAPVDGSSITLIGEPAQEEDAGPPDPPPGPLESLEPPPDKLRSVTGSSGSLTSALQDASLSRTGAVG